MAAEILGIIFLVVLAVIKILIFILCKKNFERHYKVETKLFLPKQNDFSLVTNINKGFTSFPGKHAKNSARQLIKPADTESSTSVTEKEITDAELEIEHASQDLQGSYKKHHCKGLAAPPEKLIAGRLGITCLVLICINVAMIIIPYLNPNYNSTMKSIQKEYNCGPCPKEWFTYSNSCYYFSDEKKTWKESVTTCQSKKSHLLYIDTEEEMQFLKSIMTLSWIGVFRNGAQQPWKLVNGSSAQLQIRESQLGNYSCVMVQNDYYTERCEQPHYFYCKYTLDI